MARLVHSFRTPLADTERRVYAVQVRGEQRADGLWEGWLIFVPASGGPALQTGRETVQSSFAALEYWATGLEPVYLEGAFTRATPV